MIVLRGKKVNSATTPLLPDGQPDTVSILMKMLVPLRRPHRYRDYKRPTKWRYIGDDGVTELLGTPCIFM